MKECAVLRGKRDGSLRDSKSTHMHTLALVSYQQHYPKPRYNVHQHTNLHVLLLTDYDGSLATNLSKTKSGTKSQKKSGIFGLKSYENS